MGETFEAIEKKIEDRQTIVRKKTEDLHSKVEEKKNEKADMGQSIDSKKGEVKRRKGELRRLKEKAEEASVQFRKRKRELSHLKMKLSNSREGFLYDLGLGISFLIPFGTYVYLTSWEQSEDATRRTIDGAEGLKKEAENLLRESNEEKKKLMDGVFSLRSCLLDLERSLPLLETELSKDKVERKNCTECLCKIREVQRKAGENANVASNSSQVADLAFDMAQMAIPLNELLVTLERNQLMLDNEAKVEVQQARVKFNALKASGFKRKLVKEGPPEVLGSPSSDAFHVVQEENQQLRSKNAELEKQVSDLTVTNEFLLDQIALLRK